MHRFPSKTLTQYSRPSTLPPKCEPPELPLKETKLRKSFFNPAETLADQYATRRHLAGAEVPLIEIVHYSPRWLLLQTVPLKTDFFRKVNLEKLGLKE